MSFGGKEVRDGMVWPTAARKKVERPVSGRRKGRLDGLWTSVHGGVGKELELRRGKEREKAKTLRYKGLAVGKYDHF